jgi:putative CocE/NonD family hydrolase
MAALGHEARLIVGPWTHLAFADPIGAQLFGARGSREGVSVHPHGDVNDLQLAWLHRQLVNDSDIELPDAPVRVFVMGRNCWRDESSWPPRRAVYERWYIRSDGSLTTRTPEPGERPSEFEYDPANPVPTVGGHTVMSPGYPAGPMEQQRIEARADVLVFTSEPLQHDLEVTGRVRMVLQVDSSAPSTDWVARLCDVHTGGESFNICDGIVRTGNDDRADGRYEVDLWSTSNVFLRGHRLRVHVTSSSFPRWDRNLNTGNQRASRHQVAHQRVHHDADRPSYIELPIIRGAPGATVNQH